MASDVSDVAFRNTRSPSEQTLADSDLLKNIHAFSARFFGVCFSAMGFALLVFPFGMTTTTEILCKMMVALIIGFVGIALWQSTKPVNAQEIELDLDRREVRIKDTANLSEAQIKVVKFAELSGFAQYGDAFELWDNGDKPLATLTLNDPHAHQLLRDALNSSGVRT